ncbi:MAG: hypothetical protein ACM3ML_33910 [Micromonosporaceae bacterium]
MCGSANEIGDPLEGVSALVDQSLVILDRNHPEGRYEMLDIVCEYAAQRLTEAGEGDEVSRRHALHYLRLAPLTQSRVPSARLVRGTLPPHDTQASFPTSLSAAPGVIAPDHSPDH